MEKKTRLIMLTLLSNKAEADLFRTGRRKNRKTRYVGVLLSGKKKQNRTLSKISLTRPSPGLSHMTSPGAVWKKKLE